MHATADAVDLFSRLALAASVTRSRFVFTSVTRMRRRHHCPPHHRQPHLRYIKPEEMKPNAHYRNKTMPSFELKLISPLYPARKGRKRVPSIIIRPCTIHPFAKNDTPSFEFYLISAISGPKGRNRMPSIRIRPQ